MYMVKKLFATGLAVTVLGLAAGSALAQTTTPSPTVSQSPSPSPSQAVQGTTTVPQGAPATGMAK